MKKLAATKITEPQAARKMMAKSPSVLLLFTML
jgi:hypothetical protein